MSYQKPEIWTETKGQYGISWRASWDEVAAVYPELIKNLEKAHGFKWDDGAKYRYSVTYKDGYGYTVWRNEKSNRGGGNFNRPRQFQSPQKTTGQKTLSDTEVKYEELAARTEQWMQNINFKLDRLLQESNIDPAGIKPASSLKNDHGNEMGGDNAAGLALDADVEIDDGLPEPTQTPGVISDIDAAVGPEQED